MKSKKYLSLIALAIGLGSCTNDLADETNSFMGNGDVIAVTMDDADSRTAMDGVNVVWSAEDSIGVFVGSSNNKYVLTGEGGTTSGDFQSEGLVLGGTKEVAYFPFVDGATWNSSTKVISTTLPATYEYAEGTNNNAVMAALMTEDAQSSISFQNAGALYAITIENIPVGYDKAVMTYLGTDDQVGIAGAATITFADGVPTLAVPDVASAQKTITITFTGTGNKTFYFPMPVKDSGYANKLKFSLQGTDKEDITAPVFTKEPVRNKLYSVTLKLDNVSGGIVTEVNDIDAANTELAKDAVASVAVKDATDNEAITIPAKSAESAAVAHTIDLSEATLPTTGSVKIVVTKGTGEKATVEKLTVIVPEGASAGSYTINAPGTTVTIQGSDGTIIETIEATTADQTLIIGEGLTIKNLTIKKGNVELYGKLEKFTSEVSTTIKLMKDIDLTSAWEITQGMNVTLDLNDKTLTGNVEGYLIESNGNLTISNGFITNVGGAVLTKGGTLKMTDCKVTVTGGKWEYNAVEVTEGTNAEITGGWYKSTGTLAEGERDDWYGIGIVAGTVTLNTTVEGTFNGGVTLAPKVAGTPTVTITGGSYSGNKYHGLNMNGGILTIEGNPTFSGNGGDIRVYTKTGTINGIGFGDYGNKTYTLAGLKEIIAYATLVKAIATGGQVTLETDVTLTEALTISNDVTLNLNGKTLTGDVEGYLFESSGNLTISNGYITNIGGAVLAKGGTLKMTDCKVTVTGGKWEYNAVEVTEGTTAEITGGWYKSTGTLAEGERDDWYGIGIVDGTVTLNTTIEGTFNGGVTLAPVKAGTPTVTITGGSYSGKLYHGLNMNGGILTIEGNPTFSGKGGDIRVYTKTGTINGIGFGTEGNKTYTLEELLQVIASKKPSAE